MSKIAAIIGRVLIAVLFIASGIGKLVDVHATQEMLAAVGLQRSLAIPVGLFELFAGLCLAAGFLVRIMAVLLAVFTAGTILFFHNRFTDPAQAVALLKNLAVIGGLFLAFAHSQMWSHYYAIRRARHDETVTREADLRVHEAELRAARAEATAEATHAVPVGRTYVETEGGVIRDTNVVRKRRWFDW